LHYAHVGGLFHFGDGVEEAVGGNAGVGVDWEEISSRFGRGKRERERASREMLTDENVVSYANVAVGPSTSVLFKDVLEGLFIGQSLIVLAPVGGTVNFGKLLLDLAGDHEREIHIRSFLDCLVLIIVSIIISKKSFARLGYG